MVSVFLSNNTMAMTDTMKTMLLMKIIENNKINAARQTALENEKKTKQDRSIDGVVIYSQSEDEGQSVAIIETKECGKLGYTTTDKGADKTLVESQNVVLKVNNCEIIKVDAKAR
jgi:hypothetical protein